MRITLQLALNQIKGNRKRTAAGILSVSLATALNTSVMCFAESAKQMLNNFLGTDYGGYGGMYFLLLSVPVVIIGLLIALVSVAAISNIFAASANKRMQEFGILKCVGGTKKQIKESVIGESLWLCVSGIPLGLLLGTAVGAFLVSVLGHRISGLNELSQKIIMRPFTFSLEFHISAWTYVIAAVFSFLIVLWSAEKPAKAAGRLSPMQCVKGTAGDAGLREMEVKRGLSGIFFGYEGEIAQKTIRRNRLGYRAAKRSLMIGIMLLMLVGGLFEQAKELNVWMSPDTDEMDVNYCSIRDTEVNPATGRTEEIIVSPIYAETYKEITQRLEDYGELEVYGIGRDSCTYHTVLDLTVLSEDMKKAEGIDGREAEMRVSVISTDERLYRKLCERAGAPYGSALLINSYQYNDNGRSKSISPFAQEITEILLMDASEKKTLLSIGGFLEEEDLEEKGFHEIQPDPVRIVVPDAAARYFDWFCIPEDEQEFTEYARAVMDEYYPILTEDSYVQQGYTVRISRADTMAEVMNITVVLAQAILYGIVAVLILIGFASVISTLATNVRMRSREFAMLKSIGMTKESLYKMLCCESLLCMRDAMLPGIVLGIAIPYAINLAVRRVVPVRYHIPWEILLFGAAGMTAAVMAITCAELNKMKHQSIIEEIRRDVM